MIPEKYRYNVDMKIILVSDTHTNASVLAKVKEKFPGYDHYIHCGDILVSPDNACGFHAVAGNLDDSSLYPQESVLNAGRLRILIKHGHDLFIGADPNYRSVARYARKNGYDAVFFGHSHIYYDGEVDGIRLLNPGSLWKSRDNSPRTFMIVTIEDDVIKAEKKTSVDLL